MLTLPISLLFAHWIGDFVLQSDKMALNKSRHWGWLAYHCSVYSLTIVTWLIYWILSLYTVSHDVSGVWFYLVRLFGYMFVVTFLTHFATDAVTSRVTSRLWFFKEIDISYNIGEVRYKLFIPRGGRGHMKTLFNLVEGLHPILEYGDGKLPTHKVAEPSGSFWVVYLVCGVIALALTLGLK